MKDEDLDLIQDDIVKSVMNDLLDSIKGDNGTYIRMPNTSKINDLVDVYEISLKIFGEDGLVAKSIGNIHSSGGVVSVLGNNFSLDEHGINLFMRAIEKANTFEMVPRTDGKLLINFTFEDLIIETKI